MFDILHQASSSTKFIYYKIWFIDLNIFLVYSFLVKFVLQKGDYFFN